ncbi:unnamed protein product [Closterium sp. NIES-53]
MTTLRVLLHVAAQRDYELHSLNFSTTFLQGGLHEEIWLRRPPGFTGSFPPGTKWSLRRPVYGLRQAPCEWHDTLRTTLAALGFAPSTADPSLFLRTDTSFAPFYILVYVDDLVFATADTAELAHVKSELQKRHTCTDLGELRSYLGLQITRDRAQCTITVTQSHMVQQVLQRFDFTYSSPQATPLSTRHSLSTLPSDESVEPSGPILARYVAPGRHRPEHMAAAKRVLRYFCSTSGLGLVLGGRRPVVLTGHADASWADDQATQRSSQGYTFSLGSGSVSWRSTRSSSVLGSSCEAEIYAGAMAAQELRWLTYMLTDLGEPPRSPPVLYVDNKAMLALCREHRMEHRTKQIALRYFLARELQQRGQLRLAYVASEANTADIFTKALPPGDRQRFCTMLACFALLDWSCDLLFSPTLPMGVFLLVPNPFASSIIPHSFTASPAADNSHLQQQQQQQYQQQPMYGMPLSNQLVQATTTAASSTVAAATVATAATTAAAAVTGSSSQPGQQSNFLMKNGITLLGEPGKFTLKYGDKKLGKAVEQNGVFVLNFIHERTSADSDNILSLGAWEHRDDIDYTDDTVPREGVVPTSSTTAAAVMLTFDDQGFNDVQSSREYMAAVEGWGDPTNMPTDDGIWGADEPDETTWGETPAERDNRLLAEAEQRIADMEILDSGRLVGVEPVPAASDQESGELVLAPGEYVDVEVRVPPPNLTRYVAPAFDQIRSDGHQLLLSFFPNAEYYLRAQGHKGTGETWHKRLGHPLQFMLNNTIKAAVLDKNSLLLPSGLELKPVNRPAPCTICPAANLPHEPFPTHFPGAEDYHMMDKVYSDILNLPADGFNGERYVITFTEDSTRYVWTGNMTNRFLAFTPFRTWLPLAERQSDTKLKATLQEKMRALLAQAQLGPLYWPFAMNHATVLHNLLSSSALPNNASPYLLWTGKLGTTKLLRVFGCVVQYRPPTTPLGKIDLRAKWGLHLGIEKQYLAWRIMDYRSRLLVPARDCIFYENLTLPVFEQQLATQQNPATLFHGVRSFTSADAELAASEEPDPDGAREAVPDPPVPVTSSGILEFIPLADVAAEDVRDVLHTYLVDEQRQPMPVVSDSSIHVNPDEIGGGNRHASVRLVLCEAAAKKFPLRRIDVSNAFLYADVDVEIYVEYPHTYPTNPPSVCKLKKSLYGIKEAPRLWQQHLNRKLTEVGFRQLPHDPGMYRLDNKGSYALLVAYVDDILYINSSTTLGACIEADLKKSLDLTISTKVTQFQGLNVSRTSSAIHLTASKYAESLAKHFNISTDFVATPYRSTLTGHVPNLKNLSAAGLQLYQQQLGCLLFAAVTCRPDLAYVASHLAQFLRCPKEEHSLDL